MRPQYKLENDYELTHIASGQKASEQLTNNPYEKLQDKCAVSMLDWTPEQDELLEIEGEPTCSIAIIIEGEGEFSVAGGQALSISNDSFFIFRTLHPTLGTNRFKAGKRILGVDFRYPHSLFNAYEGSFLNHLTVDDKRTEVLFEKRVITQDLMRISHEVLACEMEGLPRELFLRGKALEVLAYIAQDTLVTPPVSPPPIYRDHLSIKLAQQILEERYQEPWTIKLLSNEVGINERKIKEGFKLVLKTSFLRCLEDIRLRHACRLLTHTRYSVTTIGADVGYNSSSHFTSVFRKQKGMTPTQWRKSQP